MNLGPRDHGLCVVYLRYPENITNGRINWEDCCLPGGISEQEIILPTPTPLCPPEISKLFYHERLILYGSFQTAGLCFQTVFLWSQDSRRG